MKIHEDLQVLLNLYLDGMSHLLNECDDLELKLSKVNTLVDGDLIHTELSNLLNQYKSIQHCIIDSIDNLK
jgi:hypothetical protein